MADICGHGSISAQLDALYKAQRAPVVFEQLPLGLYMHNGQILSKLQVCFLQSLAKMLLERFPYPRNVTIPVTAFVFHFCTTILEYIWVYLFKMRKRFQYLGLDFQVYKQANNLWFVCKQTVKSKRWEYKIVTSNTPPPVHLANVQ